MYVRRWYIFFFGMSLTLLTLNHALFGAISSSLYKDHPGKLKKSNVEIAHYTQKIQARELLENELIFIVNNMDVGTLQETFVIYKYSHVATKPIKVTSSIENSKLF